MKNKPIRQEELTELGRKINLWIGERVRVLAERLNQQFAKNRKRLVVFIVILFVLIFIFNILSFIYF